MTRETSRHPPHLTPVTERARAERLARLAAAMRENLKKRKAQKRARQVPAEVAPPARDEHP